MTETARGTLAQLSRTGQGLHVAAVDGGCLGTALRFELREGGALSVTPPAARLLGEAALDFRGRRFRAQPAPADFAWCACGRSKGNFAQLDLARCVAREIP